MTNIPKPEFPNPLKERHQWMNLNGTWAFQLFPAGQEAEEAVFSKDRSAYDREIVVPFSWVAPLSGVAEDVAGIGWYRCAATFDGGGDRVFLCFGAVDYRCDVYVNGAHLTSHRGGYTPFEADATEVWTKDENIIEVRAEDYREKNQTYGKQGYGDTQGIWQTVWLERRPRHYIESMWFDTRLDGTVTLHAEVHAAAAGEAALTAAFGDCEHTAQVTLEAGINQLSLPFEIENPRLWSPEDPYLYEGCVTLAADGAEDRVQTYFGVREIGIGKFNGRSHPWVTLNGRPLYINGTLDQAFHPAGHFTYPSDEAMRMEAWRLKRLGLNMARIHIKPEEPRKIYWMDKLGVLIMQDIPNFWGEPDETARAAYESEWPDVIRAKRGHPSIFSWVMFNETWGLKTGEKHQYLPETQKWVQSVYRAAKAMDPTRLIEDNSACLYDHVESDLNTWHFYLNGYELVRDHIREVVEKTFVGSQFNYAKGYRQTDIPLMNSECGMVWGVDGSAGDSDLAWQYRYMLNEFRLHDKIGGFIFTEFHDVVNEFNGYYRIDDSDKDFGFQDFCRGMTIRDLHAADFVAIDAPPCKTVAPGEVVSLPLVLSSFTNQHHGQKLTVDWEAWYDGLDGRVVFASGRQRASVAGYGATCLGEMSLDMPTENAVAVVSLYLRDEAGAVISRNFTTFDVRADWPESIVAVPVSSGVADGFPVAWQALGGAKANFADGCGEVRFDIDLSALRQRPVHGLTIFFEAGAKRVLTKDRGGKGGRTLEGDFMLGYKVDRGDFANSYWMTDENTVSSEVEVVLDGVSVASIALPNDPADARGVLSWHAQPSDRKLDEAGSYGYLHRVEVPSRLIPAMIERGRATLMFKVSEGGLALYGRDAGRYPVDLMIRAW